MMWLDLSVILVNPPRPPPLLFVVVVMVLLLLLLLLLLLWKIFHICRRHRNCAAIFQIILALKPKRQTAANGSRQIRRRKPENAAGTTEARARIRPDTFEVE